MPVDLARGGLVSLAFFANAAGAEPPHPRLGACAADMQGVETMIVASPLRLPLQTDPEKKVFKVFGDIDLWDGELTNHLISHAHDDDKSKIFLQINSIGGAALTALAAVDAMEYYGRSNITTFCMGSAESAAGLLLVAGGVRFATEHCDIMTHAARSDLYNPDLLPGSEKVLENERTYHPDVLAAAKASAEASTEALRKMYGIYSGNRLSEACLAHMTRTAPTYFTAEEALKLGLVDYVLGKDGSALQLKP